MGCSVDINDLGDMIIVGGRESNRFENDGGIVRVFKLRKLYNNDDIWVQIGLDTDIQPYTYDVEMGYAVSMNAGGNIIAVSSPYEDTYHTNGGVVRVYYLNSSQRWILQGTIESTRSSEYSGGGSGESLSLNNDGTVLAVGAYQNSDVGTYGGEVRIYKYTSSWFL